MSIKLFILLLLVLLMIDIIEDCLSTVEYNWESILESSGQNSIQYKKHGNDLLTDVDIKVERIIRDEIKSRDSNSRIVGEELENENSGVRTYYIDPIDGTFNFGNGLPEFCVSIGCEEDEEIISSGVYFPVFDTKILCDRKRGVRTKGDYFHNRLIEGFCPSETNSLGRSSLAIDVIGSTIDELGPMRNLLQQNNVVRQPMSGVYTMVMVSSGSFDSSILSGLHPWDIAPGYIIVEEIGGVISDSSGNTDWLDLLDANVLIVSGNKEIHQSMLDLF